MVAIPTDTILVQGTGQVGNSGQYRENYAGRLENGRRTLRAGAANGSIRSIWTMAMKILKELRVTLTGAILAVALVLTASLAKVDLVKVNLKLLDGIEKNEVDDLVSGFTLIFVCLLIDRILSVRRKRREAEIEAQKLRTLKATMRTVQDIVNNFLNNLLLFEMEAAAVMPLGSLEPLEQLIQETFRKLKSLGDIESVREKPLASGVGIDYTEIITSLQGTEQER
jgi:hypothetical protein